MASMSSSIGLPSLKEIIQTDAQVRFRQFEENGKIKTTYVDYIQSTIPGLGTASMRQVIKISLENATQGCVKLCSIFSSHFFYLYLGFIPSNYSLSSSLGIGQVEIEELLEMQKLIKEKKQLNAEYQRLKGNLVKMLSHSHKVTEDQVTDEMILQLKEGELTKFFSTFISGIPPGFINSILSKLSLTPSHQRPDTSDIDSCEMHLTDEGMERWKKVIMENKPFPHFKKLEHLRPHMTPQQLTQLDNIVQAREKALPMT